MSKMWHSLVESNSLHSFQQVINVNSNGEFNVVEIFKRFGTMIRTQNLVEKIYKLVLLLILKHASL